MPQDDTGSGVEVEREIVNTVFFEGSPTLNQYGMAIDPMWSPGM